MKCICDGGENYRITMDLSSRGNTILTIDVVEDMFELPSRSFRI